MTAGSHDRQSSMIEIVKTLSTIHSLDEFATRIEGSLNLLTKAGTAIRRGGPGDRAKALSLLDRAAGVIPAEADVPEDYRDSLAEIATSIDLSRREALGLAE
jgi:hypothetical protein